MYNTRSKRVFESDKNWKQIDAMAHSNARLKEEQLQEMINTMNHMGAFFDYFNAQKAQAIATRLQSVGIGVLTLRKASRRVIEGFDRFPSYKAIYELCRITPVEVYDVDWENHLQMQKREDDELQQIRKKFGQAFGEKDINKITEWWIRSNYDMDKTHIEHFITDNNVFMKCVLFDWKDAGYPLKHFKEKMKEVFDAKAKKLKLNNNHNKLNSRILN